MSDFATQHPWMFFFLAGWALYLGAFVCAGFVDAFKERKP